MTKKNIKLETKALNTWCPGCTNFAILTALKKALQEMFSNGLKSEEVVLVSGIGCSSKIIDYVNLNSFSALHGRAVASAQGIKLANPDLKVIVIAGDGGNYNEGISHLIHAAKRNTDLTVLIHDNRTFALTTSQFTATSPLGFPGRSTPEGSPEEPFNPLELMLASKASFLARGYAMEIEHLKNLIKQAVQHKGFSFVEILQPCITFFNNIDFYKQRVYKIKETNLSSRAKALEKIQEWDYMQQNTKIPLGVFYKKQRSVYEDKID